MSLFDDIVTTVKGRETPGLESLTAIEIGGISVNGDFDVDEDPMLGMAMEAMGKDVQYDAVIVDNELEECVEGRLADEYEPDVFERDAEKERYRSEIKEEFTEKKLGKLSGRSGDYTVYLSRDDDLRHKAAGERKAKRIEEFQKKIDELEKRITDCKNKMTEYDHLSEEAWRKVEAIEKRKTKRTELTDDQQHQLEKLRKQYDHYEMESIKCEEMHDKYIRDLESLKKHMESIKHNASR